MNVDYLLAFIRCLEPSDITLSWKRDIHDKQKYRLTGVDGENCGCVWKIGKTWGSLSGSVFPTLREARYEAFEELKARMSTKITEIASRMERYKLCYNPVFSTFELSPIEKRALAYVLNKQAEVMLGPLVKSLPNISIRDANNRFGNVLCAFDYKGDMVSFLEPGIRFSFKEKNVHRIDLSQLCFDSSITKDINGPVLTKDEAFLESGMDSADIVSLSQTDVDNAITSLFRMTIKYLEHPLPAL